MSLKEAITELEAVMAEKQRMATVEVVARMRHKIEDGGMSPADAGGEALDEVWAQRGLDTPASGWNPGE